MNTKHPALTLPLNDTTSTSFHINILLLLQVVVFMSKKDIHYRSCGDTAGAVMMVIVKTNSIGDTE